MYDKLVRVIALFITGLGVASSSVIIAQNNAEIIQLSESQAAEFIDPIDNEEMATVPRNVSMEEFMLDDCKSFAVEEGVSEEHMDSYLESCVEDLKKEYEQPSLESGYGNKNNDPFMT